MDKLIRDYENAAIARRPLEQLAEVFKGKAISPKDTPGDVAVINLRDIGPLGIEGRDLQSISGDRRLLQRYLLEDGDVLVASKGTVHKTAVFEEQDFPCVASANIIVVRPGKELSGYYLKFFLESPLGLALLDQASSSQSLLNISSKALRQIQIPSIPMVKQGYLAQRYLQGREDYKRKLSRANQEWQRIQEEIRKQLY